MEQEEINRRNKLLVEFMGYEYLAWNDPNYRCSDYTSGYWGNKNAKAHHLKAPNSMLFNPLMYNSSWDWLMPVVEKIEGINNSVIMVGNNCMIQDRNFFTRINDKPEVFIDSYGNSKIEAVFIACSDFVEQLNKQP